MKITQYEPGMTVTAPCLVADMPNDVYHAWPDSISKSGLDLIDRSPAHYYFQAKREPTRAMAIGTAIHTALLEPDRFHSEYVLLNHVKDRRSSVYKEAIKVHGDELVLVASEADNVIGMQESVYANKQASALLNAEGYREASLFVNDPVTGILVRCRYDILLLDGTIGDVKKTQDARPTEFSKSIYNYRYHVQAALYSDALDWAFGIEAADFKFLAVEEKAPNSSMVYKMDYTAMTEGRKEYRRNLDTYAECVKSGHWPSYENGDDDVIGLPDWKIRQIEYELDETGITTGE